MKTVAVTGACGLIGTEASLFYLNKGCKIVGIDNDMRSYFYGAEGSTKKSLDLLKQKKNYFHYHVDIRDFSKLREIFVYHKIDIILHTASQPSHDWATKDPILDFEVNALGTLNLLELTRKFSPGAVFVFTSTNKLIGDGCNYLNLVETEKRFDFADEKYKDGIDESFSIDQCKHSLFGCSKASADLYTQEYGKYFGLKTGVFRGGCLTGKNHASVELHGFLSYLIKCAKEGRKYRIFGYGGRQVRDQIHSYDVLTAIDCFVNNPKCGEVYNIGGGKENSASILEIIDLLKEKYNLVLNYEYVNTPRAGDHVCYYTNLKKLKTHYPEWNKKYTLEMIIDEMVKE